MVTHLIKEFERMKYKWPLLAQVLRTPHYLVRNHTVILCLQSYPWNREGIPPSWFSLTELPVEQRRDPFIMVFIDYLLNGKLPKDKKQSQILVAKASSYCLMDDILYFINNKKRKCRLAVVPKQLWKKIIEENHGGPLGGHYSGNWLYNILSNHWY